MFTYKGEDIVETILHFAREYRVGHIVIGASRKKSGLWRRLTGRASVPERLAAAARGMTVVIMDAENLPEPAASVPPPAGKAAAPEPADGEPPEVIARAPVIVWEEAIDKETALRELVAALRTHHPEIAEAGALEKIQERERQGATFVTEDMAIPHARIEGLERPVLAFGISRTGIPDPASGGIARIMVLMLSPLADPSAHVRLLGAVGRMARDDHWHRRMVGASDAEEAATLLREWAENP